ncbi:MAG: hypothetical protein WAM14_10295 [Candidatus Nitrosopolaris sp.]
MDRKANTKEIDLSYRLDGIRKPLNPQNGWLGMDTYEQAYIENRLQGFQKEDLITLFPEQFRLTSKGVQHCEQSSRTQG